MYRICVHMLVFVCEVYCLLHHLHPTPGVNLVRFKQSLSQSVQHHKCSVNLCSVMDQLFELIFSWGIVNLSWDTSNASSYRTFEFLTLHGAVIKNTQMLAGVSLMMRNVCNVHLNPRRSVQFAESRDCDVHWKLALLQKNTIKASAWVITKYAILSCWFSPTHHNQCSNTRA